jgi:hypothetical protein
MRDKRGPVRWSSFLTWPFRRDARQPCHRELTHRRSRATTRRCSRIETARARARRTRRERQRPRQRLTRQRTKKKLPTMIRSVGQRATSTVARRLCGQGSARRRPCHRSRTRARLRLLGTSPSGFGSTRTSCARTGGRGEY